MSMDYSANSTIRKGLAVPVSIIEETTRGLIVTPSSSGNIGLGTIAFRSTAVTNAATSIKAAPGKVHGYSFSNPGAAACYVNLYNATAVIVGTTVPALQVLVPAGQTVSGETSLGIQFGTGITIAATDASSPNSIIAVATLPVVNVQYI